MRDKVSSAAEWRKAGLSMAMRKAEEEASERLRTDPQAKDIIEGLRKKGVSGDEIDFFLNRLPEIIGHWEKIKDTSLKKMCDQSAKLAKKMRDLAKEIEKYHTGRLGISLFMYGIVPFQLEWHRLVDKKELDKKGLPPFPNLQYLLNYLARWLELESNQKFMKKIPALIPEETPYSGGLKIYAVKEVSRRLINLLPDIRYYERAKKRRSPNKETAIIVNTLLDLENPLTGKLVCSILKKTRNKYNQW